MKLKDKLFTAFFIMMLLPILLIFISASTIVNLQLNSIHRSYDMEADPIQIITNPIQILNRLTRGIYNEIKFATLKAPETLEDTDYINELNQELKTKYSFLALRKEGEFIFVGDEKLLPLVKNSLQAFGVNQTDVDGGVYIAGKNPFLVKAQDFYFSDGAEGTIFVVTNLDTLIPQIKAVAFQIVISFMIIICFSAFTLMVWIYRSIVRPLNILRIGMNQIKEGDLDYSVESDTEDEIGQLCDDFEEMRIRLKELIDSRLAYEEDIKGLISNISHDLKTPLTAIKGYAEGLIDGVADTPERQEKYLKTIMTKANDMSILVDELAFYTQIDCNTIPYSFEKIRLREYFNDCIEELSLELEIKKIQMHYENTTFSDTEVVADAEQLKRVINNIIGNAVKYMDKEAAWIHIRLLESGNFVQVEIEDNGIGIPKADLPYIFDRFYRADASRNSRKGGSGLGLAISKKIIEDHGGKIWVKSELGNGTTICFTLRKGEKTI